jgi:ketosteroid isomerase-like protein
MEDAGAMHRHPYSPVPCTVVEATLTGGGPVVTPQEEANMLVAGVLAATTARYAAKQISAADFAEELTKFMTADVEFWSNYTPSWEPLRPLFAECRSIEEIVARYDYENEHEVIEHGSGVPFDFAISGDVVYYTQRETAAFFGKSAVTWDMVTKIDFRDEKIARIRMFLDPTPIEEVYGAPGT